MAVAIEIIMKIKITFKRGLKPSIKFSIDAGRSFKIFKNKWLCRAGVGQPIKRTAALHRYLILRELQPVVHKEHKLMKQLPNVD